MQRELPITFLSRQDCQEILFVFVFLHYLFCICICICICIICNAGSDPSDPIFHPEKIARRFFYPQKMDLVSGQPEYKAWQSFHLSRFCSIFTESNVIQTLQLLVYGLKFCNILLRNVEHVIKSSKSPNYYVCILQHKVKDAQLLEVSFSNSF